MDARLEINSYQHFTIPAFIKLLEWIQTCPTKNLEITIGTLYLEKLIEKPKELGDKQE